MVQAVTRAIRATGCAHCRTSLLRAFTSIAGVQWPSSQLRPRQVEGRARTTIQYSSSIPPNFSKPVDNGTDSIEPQLDNAAEASDVASQDEILVFESIEETLITEDEAILEDEFSALEGFDQTETTQDESTPWYLQVNTPSTATPTLSARQTIPSLPPSPPPILAPLLQRISIELGLDDLALLDLRNLDPPPALGSNLLMIVGTARSEKHLHVSADRLCRWLRTEYKLRPDADGLLGRNELKLKLKRKAKRARLVGMPHEDDADDGVRTGWVCVNVGTVESGVPEVEEAVKDNGYVGFGRKTEGTKIVVQMLVEEKRIELDLERLWRGIAKRQSAGLPLEADEGVAWETVENSEVSEASSQGESPAVKVHDAYPTSFPTTSSFSPISVQARGFHTTARTF